MAETFRAPSHMLIILCVSIVGSILCFIPLLFEQTSGFEELEKHLDSDIVNRAFVASIALVAPIGLDTLLDLKFLPATFTMPRIALLLALLIPATLNLTYPGNSDVYLCCAHSGEILFVGSLLSYLTVGNISRSLSFFATAMATTYTTGILLNNFSAFHLHGCSCEAGSLVLSGVAFLGIFVLCAHQTYSFCNKRIPTDTANFTIMYVISLCSNILGKWIAFMYFDQPSWSEFRGSHIAAHAYIDMVTVLISATFPVRVARSEGIALKCQLAAKKDFVRYISHEIRTPLNTVHVGINLLSESLSSNDKTNIAYQLDLCNDVAVACVTAVDMLNDLLLYDKIEEGNMILEKTLINFHLCYQQTVKMFAVQARALNITLNYSDVSPEIEAMTILMDVNKVSQVIRNMVSNALKFSPPGSTVTVRAKVISSSTTIPTSSAILLKEYDEEEGCIANDFLRVEVQDEGPGLTPYQQDRLFKEVIQFNAAILQNGGGSGLGLWISSAIMAKHDGIMGVESTGVAGQGCLFYMEMPILKSHETPTPTTALTALRQKPNPVDVPELPMMPTFSVGRKQVICGTEADLLDLGHALVCDDSGVNRKMLTKVLARDFKQFTEADDGQNALEVFARSVEDGVCFDAIFMDDGMPRMMGREAIQHLRGKYQYKGPIIAVTGNILADDVDALMSAGATAVCSKPLDKKLLRQILVEHFGRIAF